MSSVFSFALSAHVNSVESFGDVYRVSCTHLDKYNTFQFDLITSAGMMPPSSEDNIIIFDAVPLNSSKTPDGYIHDQRMIATGRTRIVKTTGNETINSITVSGRLADDAFTKSGPKSDGTTYKLTRFKILFDYWNGREEETVSYFSSYWKAELKGLLKGNGAVIKGQLKSELNAADNKTYFNVAIYDFDYGQTSKKNGKKVAA